MDNNMMQNGAWGFGGMPGGGVPGGNMVPDGGMMPSSEPMVPMPGEVKPNKKPTHKSSDSKKLWMGLAIVFGILAVAGVSFGIVMALKGNEKTEELTSQVDKLEEQNDDLLAQLKNQIAEGEHQPITLLPIVAEPVDYIYVGEWGIRIKKPSNWRNIIREYAFFNDYPQAMDVLEIKEDPEVPTAHALIVNEGEVACENVTVNYDACFKVANNTYIVTGLPEIGTGGVTDEFRNFVLNSENYLTL